MSESVGTDRRGFHFDSDCHGLSPLFMHRCLDKGCNETRALQQEGCMLPAAWARGVCQRGPDCMIYCGVSFHEPTPVRLSISMADWLDLNVRPVQLTMII